MSGTPVTSVSAAECEMLRQLEEELLNPAVRRSPELAGRLLAEDFIEFGGSGVVYDKRRILEALRQEASGPPAVISDCAVRRLSADVILATYRTGRGEASRLRSSVWKLMEGRWQMVFHQGTPSAS